MTEEMWSVQIAGDWSDDTFNGTYDECVEFCEEHDYTVDGIEARLAKVLVEDGYVLEVLEIVEEL